MAFDASRSQPVPIKKSLVLVNDFIINTTRFLNHFSTLAEEKLLAVSQNIERVETALVLLESKLSRIPGMEDPVLPPPTAVSTVVPAGTTLLSASAPAASTAAAAPHLAPPPPPEVLPTAGGSASMPPPMAPPPNMPPPPPMAEVAAAAPLPPAPMSAPAASSVVPVSEDPSYAPFFKMARMGVPPPAVKQKMGLAGLNPDMLDTPDAPSPFAGGGAATAAPAPAPAPAAAPLPPPLPVPAAAAAAPPAPVLTVGNDPAYAPFFKMARMGVPPPAVKQKMGLAGLNPDLLDTPDAPSPSASALVVTDDF